MIQSGGFLRADIVDTQWKLELIFFSKTFGHPILNDSLPKNIVTWRLTQLLNPITLFRNKRFMLNSKPQRINVSNFFFHYLLHIIICPYFFPLMNKIKVSRIEKQKSLVHTSVFVNKKYGKLWPISPIVGINFSIILLFLKSA